MGEKSAVVEIDAAALHMARLYGPDVTANSRRRWAGRIRSWACRYRDEITDHGRNGRRRQYDLRELQQVAARVVASPAGPDL